MIYNPETESIRKSEDRLSRLTTAFQSILTEYNELKQITERSNQAAPGSHFKPRFKHDKNSAPVTILRPNDLAKKVIWFISQLENTFLLLITTNNSQFQNFTRLDNESFAIKEFVDKYNDYICEIVSHLGMVIATNSKPEILGSTGFKIDDQFKLYLNYAKMITNLAEKSPIEPKPIVLNKVVDYLIESAFFLIRGSSINQIDNKQLAYEIYRALGSLIYQNGSYLNVYNLNRLFGSDDSVVSNKKTRQELNVKDGLLFLVREQVEEDISELMTSRVRDNVEVELNNKMNLITTQLTFNLTMKAGNSVNDHEKARNQNSSKYIDDCYKIKAVYLLLKIIRFHEQMDKSKAADQLPVSFINETNRHFFGNRKQSADLAENTIFTCKILTKALHGLENLLTTMKKDENETYQAPSNWLQVNTDYFQLWDILEVAKLLCIYGVNNQRFFRQQASEAKVLKTESTKTPSINATTEQSEPQAIESTESEPPMDELNTSSDNWRRQPMNNFNNNRQYYPKKFYSKTNASRAPQSLKTNKQPTKRPDVLNKQEGGDVQTNSIQCLREIHVPLLNYHKADDGRTSDSDVSNSDASSTNKFHLDKCTAKVRIAAFGVLLTSFQILDKRVILSYWDSFLGTKTSKNSNCNLLWSIRNDNSPKVRLIASNTLCIYLEHVKAFFTLTATEELSNQPHTTLFIAISQKIGQLIRELHKELLFSFCSLETFSLNQIQLLKCLQMLIRATPYEKLKPGLIYKLIINLSRFLERESPIKANGFKKLNGNNANVISEVLKTILQLLTSFYELAEIHLALFSPMKNDDNLNNSNAAHSEIDHLSMKLERLSNIYKVPNVIQSRVTYFYTSDQENSSMRLTSSLSNSSLGTSGQLSPILNAFLDSNNQGSSIKPWLINFCISISSLNKESSLENQHLNKVRGVSLELLQIVCKKYFDILQRDLLFDELCDLILNLIEFGSKKLTINDSSTQGLMLKSLKLLEEFTRCLATDELRKRNNIDLSVCCKFWLSLLNSNLVSQLLCDENYYLLSSASCDCLASIGSSIFELLPFQKKFYCLTSLLHLTKSKSTLIRSSSVRSLGVYVTFTSLKEDQTFLSDLSCSLQELLANDNNNLVRQKTAWSMSNLSEVIVENSDKLGKAFTDEFNLNVWLELLDTASNACEREPDKLKSYLVRTLGNLINYITVFDLETVDREINRAILERSITRSIESLCQCKNVKMLKVKWNLSHAIGIAMRKFNTWKLQQLNPHWLHKFYDTLLDLFTESSNYKVRINACIALMTVNIHDRSLIGLKNDSASRDKTADSIYIKLWASLISVFSKLSNVEHDADEINETQHKSTLVHQLCKFFTYLCKYLQVNDQKELLRKCFQNIENEKNWPTHWTELRGHLLSYIKEIFEKIETNKNEVQLYNDALTQLNLLNSSTKKTSMYSNEDDYILFLLKILQKPNNNKNTNNNTDDSESSEAEFTQEDMSHINPTEFDSAEFTSTRTNIKFPFKQTYD